MSTTLTYNNVTINFDGKRVNLTDMWRASGADQSKRPSEWKRQKDTEVFIEFLLVSLNVGIAHVYETRSGIDGGTWAHYQLALAYAKYLSPAFHVWCNEVIRAHMEGTSLPGPSMAGSEQTFFGEVVSDAAVQRVRLIEEQAGELLSTGRITRLQKADLMTLAIREHLGFDFTKIPVLTYAEESAPGMQSVQVPTGKPVVIIPVEKTAGVSATAIKDAYGVPVALVTGIGVALGLLGDPAFTVPVSLTSSDKGVMGENFKYLPAAVVQMGRHFQSYLLKAQELREKKVRTFSKDAIEYVLEEARNRGKIGTGTMTRATTIPRRPKTGVIPGEKITSKDLRAETYLNEKPEEKSLQELRALEEAYPPITDRTTTGRLDSSKPNESSLPREATPAAKEMPL